jgi:hypothetical protein
MADVTGTADEQTLQKWVAKSLARRAANCLLSAAVMFLVALVVLWLTWRTIHFILWLLLASFAPPTVVITVGTWVIFALLFAAYAAANRNRLEQPEFESPTRLRIASIAAIFADSPFFALTGPKTAGSFVRIVAVIVLIGPGVLMTSWKYLIQVVAAWRGSPARVAQVLETLATAGARLSLEDLVRLDPTDGIVTTFQAVRLFDGVILRDSKPVGLALTDSLRDDVLLRISPDKRRLTAAKPAPGQVSSKTTASPTKPKPKPRP